MLLVGTAFAVSAVACSVLCKTASCGVSAGAAFGSAGNAVWVATACVCGAFLAGAFSSACLGAAVLAGAIFLAGFSAGLTGVSAGLVGFSATFSSCGCGN